MQPKEPHEIVAQVAALLERNRTSQARAVLVPALKSYPDHTGLLLQAAWTDYLDDRTDDGLRLVRQVLVNEPTHSSARELLFALLTDKKDYVEAEQTVIGLLRDYPESSGLYGRYADLMLRTLNLDKAKRLAQEGLKYDPDDSECLAVRAICELIEQPQGEPSYGLQQLLVRNPQSLRTLSLVLIALQQRGDTRGAKRVAQELVAAQPDNPHLVEASQALSVSTHWSLLPLYPLQRWGWPASVALWLGGIFIVRTLRQYDPRLATIFVTVLLIYVVYSWVWPPILRRLLK